MKCKAIKAFEQDSVTMKATIGKINLSLGEGYIKVERNWNKEWFKF